MSEDRSNAAHTRRHDERPGLFERFMDSANQLLSQPPVFVVILAAIVLWAVSKPLWRSTTTWELALHTGSAILSLLLLVLLKNANRRSEEAAQEKLNVLAEGLEAMMRSGAARDPDLADAADKPREAVGLEARH